MSGPQQIQIKRKRDDRGPDQLIVEHPTKRIFTYSRDLHYVRQKVSNSKEPDKQQSDHNAVPRDKEPRGTSQSVSHRPRRTFHLSKAQLESETERHPGKKSVATFVETHGASTLAPARSGKDQGFDVYQADHVDEPLKRPGRGGMVKLDDKLHTAEQPKRSQHLESVADDLHQFALDELSREAKPRLTATPRLAGARSRELHRRHASDKDTHGLNQDVTMTDDFDYVYDVYILAPADNQDSAMLEVDSMGGNVGYLVITEEDQSIWETYLESEASDKDGDTDEEDENAEDYYGADYPEDELASDDEHDRNAYGFRNHKGSDDEEWDEDTGMYSDHEEEDRVMNPWKTKTQSSFTTYLKQADADD